MCLLHNQLVTKYIAAKNQVYSVDEQQDTDFLFNVETITAYENCQKLAEVSKAKNGVQGMVFGRVDFSGSIGLDRDSINSDRVMDCVMSTAEICKASGLQLVVGGGVTARLLSKKQNTQHPHTHTPW